MTVVAQGGIAEHIFAMPSPGAHGDPAAGLPWMFAIPCHRVACLRDKAVHESHHDQTPLDFAVIGGGAAGFFAALRFAELAPGKRVAVFEKGNAFLRKVAISGGGRCNVTHACFDPATLAGNYPRGSRELRGAFHRWQTKDTIEWFAKRGIELKMEADGRMFPVTDSSATIIRCFLEEAKSAGVGQHLGRSLGALHRDGRGEFVMDFGDGHEIRARAVCVAAGSLKGSGLADMLAGLGIEIEPLVPSLFAFDVDDARIAGLTGLSCQDVVIRLDAGGPPRRGPILITHRGFSGPAVLRLSAWEALSLAAMNHRFDFQIDWLPEMSRENVQAWIAQSRRDHGTMRVRNRRPEAIPKRLWESLATSCQIAEDRTWAQLARSESLALVDALKRSRFTAKGKTTNKDEFVTCGGVKRSAIDFRTMRSRSVPGLYFAGEVIDVDGVTGGFNFQAAWTTAHLAATAVAEQLAGADQLGQVR